MSQLETAFQQGSAAMMVAVAVLPGIGRLLPAGLLAVLQEAPPEEAAAGLADRWMGQAMDWLRDSGLQLVGKAVVFLIVLLVTWILARVVKRLVRRATRASRLEVSALLEQTAISWSGKLMWLLGILVALSLVGVKVGPVLAGLGIAGFVLGFALQETLSNFAAGLMILLYRPFDVGDFVEAAGVTGKVDAMSLVSTSILTVDNQRLIVPNGKIWGGVIRNVTAMDVRRVDLTFGISYSDDIPKAEDILKRLLREHPLVLEDPEPVVRLHSLGDSSVNFVARPWCKTEDYWQVHWDVTRSVKMAFDEEGVSIPFPQRDVHLYREGGEAD